MTAKIDYLSLVDRLKYEGISCMYHESRTKGYPCIRIFSPRCIVFKNKQDYSIYERNNLIMVTSFNRLINHLRTA